MLVLSYKVDGVANPGRIETTEFGIIFAFDKPIELDGRSFSYIVLKYWEGCEPDESSG